MTTFRPWPEWKDSSPPHAEVVQALGLVLDVLRANNLHQTHCQWRLGVEEDRRGRWLAEIPPCNCWLAEEE